MTLQFVQVKPIQYLEKLKEWGFKINPLNKTIIGVDNLMNNYHEIEKKRGELDFDIDGVVYMKREEIMVIKLLKTARFVSTSVLDFLTQV